MPHYTRREFLKTGLAAGRWLWLAFAHELSAVPDPVVPAGSVALAAVAALVLANLVGTDPDQVRVGMPIQIAYQDIPGEDVTLWRWVAR